LSIKVKFIFHILMNSNVGVVKNKKPSNNNKSAYNQKPATNKFLFKVNLFH